MKSVGKKTTQPNSLRQIITLLLSLALTFALTSRVLNLSIPGEFEKNMPAIAEYFAENPPGDA
jgi:hypothetical protein